MANYLQVHIASWVDNIGCIVTRAVVVSRARQTVASCACFQGCRMECLNLFSGYMENVSFVRNIKLDAG